MTTVKRVKVEGLAGRKDTVELVFNDKINIIFGSNGVGKTSLLKVIHSALSNRASEIRSMQLKFAEVEMHSERLDKTFIRNLSTEKNNEQEFENIETVILKDGSVTERLISQKAIRRWISDENTISRSRMQHEYLPASRIYSPIESIELVGESLPGSSASQATIDERFAKEMQHSWRRISNTILSNVNEAQDIGLMNILEIFIAGDTADDANEIYGKERIREAYEALSLFLKRRERSSVIGSYTSFQRKFAKNPSLRKAATDVMEIEKKINDAEKPRENLEKLLKKLFSRNKSVSLHDSGINILDEEGNPIDITQASSGEKHLLRIFVSAMLAGRNTIIIDEPELSLHIDWQRELIENIRLLNSESQIIVATHSPEIMAHYSDDAIMKI